jgi:hypothetical protein
MVRMSQRRAAHTALLAPYRHKVFLFSIIYNKQAQHQSYNLLNLAICTFSKSGMSSAQGASIEPKLLSFALGVPCPATS